MRFDPIFRIISRSNKVGGLVAFSSLTTRYRRNEIEARMSPFSAASAFA